jgi:two-component sensor histidine kinase
MGSRLFRRLDEGERVVQRLVGLVGGIGTILVGLVNWSIIGPSLGLSGIQSFMSSYVGLIVLMGVISLACGFWYHPIARSVHILLFVFSGIFGALTTNRGNITSGFFIVLSIVLLLEYRVNRKLAWALAVAMVVGFFVALSVGYQDDTPRPVISALASMITLLTFAGLLGGITIRHRLFEMRNAEILEERIAERTSELNAALEERTIMLNELHHRVKNNLQTVSAMLSLEEGRIPDERAREALRSSEQRVQAISRVHDTLYRSDKLDRIDLSRYAGELADVLLQTGPTGVALELDIEEGIFTSLQFATSFGLVVNELVTNALRHAFRDRTGGTIRLVVSREGSALALQVEDDGTGLPEGFTLDDHAGVGLDIVASVVGHREGQMGFHSDGGTRWHVLLPLRGVPEGEDAA